jgi:hypothetical protein
MKTRFTVFILLLYSILCNAQNRIPEGGVSVYGDAKLNKVFKPAINRGKMEWRTVPIKDHPQIKSALHLTTVNPPKDMWELQIVAHTTKQVDEGDNLLITFWGRKLSTYDDKDPGLVACVFEKASPDWNKSIHHFTELDREWKQYYYPFKSIGTYKPGEASIGFQIGTKPQMIEIANIQVLNYKNKLSVSELPSSLRVDVNKRNDVEAIAEVASKVIGPFPMNSMKTHHIVSGLAEIKKVKVENQTFTEAFQVNVRVKPKAPEDIQILAGNTLKVDQGDILHVTFKARAVPNGKTRPKTSLYCNFEPNKPPLTRSLNEDIPLDTVWRDFSFPFECKETYESGFAIFTFHCGGMVQLIEIADIQVLNYRKNITIDKLPRSKFKSSKEMENAATDIYPAGKNPVSNLMMMLYNAKATGQKIPVTGKDFTECYQIVATTLTENAKDIQCFVNTEVPIKKGDVFLLTFYARSPKAKTTTPSSISVNFGKATPNYDKSLSKRVSVGPDWKLYNMPFVVLQDFEPGAAKLSFYTGSSTVMQTIEIGKVQLTNYKKTKKVTDFPQK